MKITHLLAALALAFVTTEALAEKLVLKGSDTLGAKLVPQLAEQFKAQHPGTTLILPPKDRPPGSLRLLMAPHRSACRAGAPRLQK